MKSAIIFIISVLFSTYSSAQDFSEISDALAKGNATALGKVMANTMDYSINGKTATISKSDAENRLRSFFMENEVRSFESVHKGGSKSDVHYMIGKLFTSKGNYRITVYLIKAVEYYVIQSIEIEKDE